MTDEELKKKYSKKKHKFEDKNDYKSYPCSQCGAIDNRYGSYCWQFKKAKLCLLEK